MKWKENERFEDVFFPVNYLYNGLSKSLVLIESVLLVILNFDLLYLPHPLAGILRASCDDMKLSTSLQTLESGRADRLVNLVLRVRRLSTFHPNCLSS